MGFYGNGGPQENIRPSKRQLLTQTPSFHSGPRINDNNTKRDVDRTGVFNGLFHNMASTMGQYNVTVDYFGGGVRF